MAEVTMPRAVHDSSTRRNAALFGAVLAASLLYVFRSTVFSGFVLLYGDTVDALIEVAILEHWWNFIHGAAMWNETGYFHPYAGTLGYNDTYLIPGFFFVIARTFGLDPLLSTFCTHVVMKAIGFAGMYNLLRRACRVDDRLALVGAALFTVSNSTVLQLWHGQLTHLSLVPWLYLLGWQAGWAMLANDRRALLRNGIGFAVLYGLFALSAFYFVWFFTFYTIVLGLIAFMLAGSGRAALLVAVRHHAKDLAILAVVALVALVPLAIVYLPQLRSGSHHSWESVRDLLPDPISVINVGPGNLIWGNALSALNARFFPGNRWDGEDMVGFPILSILCSLAAFVWAWRNRGTGSGRAVLAALLALGLIVLMTLRIPRLGSLWFFVYTAVPGGSSIRAITRFFLFATTIQFAAMMIWLHQARMSRILTAILVGLLFVEQIQLTPLTALNRPEQLAWMSEVAAVPRECAAIFVISARSKPQIASDRARFVFAPQKSDPTGDAAAKALDVIWRHNVDAMLLSAIRAKPTIEGYSTFMPPDWNFDRAPAPVMIRRAQAYAQKHNIQGLCVIDRQKSERWQRIS